jgi:hypothetical protein
VDNLGGNGSLLSGDGHESMDRVLDDDEQPLQTAGGGTSEAVCLLFGQLREISDSLRLRSSAPPSLLSETRDLNGC